MNRKFALVFTLIVAGAVISRVAFMQLRKAKIAAAHSTVASLYAGLQSSNLLTEATTNWQVLGDTVCDGIVTEVSRRHSIDAGRSGWTTNGVLVDPWGNRVQIAARKKADGQLEYLVWSKGADGISKTSDDVAVPGDVKLP